MRHSGVFRSAAFAKYMPEFGITPIVICGTESDHGRAIRYGSSLDYQDDARYPTPRRIPWRLGRPDVPLKFGERVMLRSPGANTVIRRRIMNAAVKRVVTAAREEANRHSPAAVLATSPEPEALVAAIKLKNDLGIPAICDLRDPWSYSPHAKYRHRVDFFLERRFEAATLNAASKVIANTPTAREMLIHAVGLPSNKVVVIPNGYDEQDFQSFSGDVHFDPDTFVIAYTGLLTTPNSNGTAWKSAPQAARRLRLSAA